MTGTVVGYTFAGWAKLAGSDEIVYADGALVKNLATGVEGDESITLYAVFKVNTYEVTIDAVGGTASVGKITVTFDQTYGDATTAVDAITATKLGYHLVGWFTLENGGIQVTNETKVTANPYLTLYAHWEANTYDITINPNNGTIDGNDVEYVIKNGIAFDGDYTMLNSLAKARKGYTFIGWTLEKNNKDTLVDTATKVSVTLKNNVEVPNITKVYAYWEANKIKVTLNGNGGTLSKIGRAHV